MCMLYLRARFRSSLCSSSKFTSSEKLLVESQKARLSKSSQPRLWMSASKKDASRRDSSRSFSVLLPASLQRTLTNCALEIRHSVMRPRLPKSPNSRKRTAACFAVATGMCIFFALLHMYAISSMPSRLPSLEGRVVGFDWAREVCIDGRLDFSDASGVATGAFGAEGRPGPLAESKAGADCECCMTFASEAFRGLAPVDTRGRGCEELPELPREEVRGCLLTISCAARLAHDILRA
mmetsp:Transcript_99180/g.289432  ORF Transcript_99180/g.289432 Transcript_99180/m.289432 type:complete len:237 (-) Transcript_99180:191-901(-)